MCAICVYVCVLCSASYTNLGGLTPSHHVGGGRRRGMRGLTDVPLYLRDTITRSPAPCAIIGWAVMLLISDISRVLYERTEQ